MAKPLDPKEVVTVEEPCISSRYEAVAVMDLLVQGITH
jgi:hypothetical protein